MQDYAYYNGILMPYDSMTIPISDRSIFFAEAVYEVMIGSREKIYQFADHIDRLFNSAHGIGLKLNTNVDFIHEACIKTIGCSKHETFMLYIQLSGNGARRSHCPADDSVNLLITVTEYKIPESMEEIDAITFDDIRHNLCDLKTTNLLPAVLSLKAANQSNSQIAIFHDKGIVSECSHANIGLIRSNKFITPNLTSKVLPGITRSNILSACREINLETEERSIELNELFSADAVLISSTTHFVRFCKSIDNVKCSTYAKETARMLFDALKFDFLL